MRKSTIVALAILGVALVMLTLLMKAYVDQVEPEATLGKEWTERYGPSIEPGSKVRVRRVRGEPDGAKPEPGKPVPAADPKAFGLVVEAVPAADVWKADATGDTLARAFAGSAFGHYGSDRPISWVDVRLAAGGRTRARLGYRRGEDERVLVPFALPLPAAPAPGGPAGG